jgi:hypothetical protein
LFANSAAGLCEGVAFGRSDTGEICRGGAHGDGRTITSLVDGESGSFSYLADGYFALEGFVVGELGN